VWVLENLLFCELCLSNTWVVEKRVILWFMSTELVSYWPCELLKNVWFLWVMPVERMSYWVCVLLKNMWFCTLCLLSVWVIVAVTSSDIIRYSVWLLLLVVKIIERPRCTLKIVRLSILDSSCSLNRRSIEGSNVGQMLQHTAVRIVLHCNFVPNIFLLA